MPSRQGVYACIDSERAYQNALPPSRSDGEPKQVGSFLSLMGHCLRKAEAAYYENAGDLSALNEIRKVAALAVACMEQHGYVNR